VSRLRSFDIAVLGGGPAGLVAALVAARSARTVLVLNRPPRHEGPLRIDAVPARTLALLVELGIAPQTIGAETLHERQDACWQSATPEWKRAAKTAHIERPRLELALFEVLRADGRIHVVIDDTRLKSRGNFFGPSWRARHLIDATGRAAVTARARLGARPAWGSRFFWTTRRATLATPDFRIAALPDGYAYRLGAAEHIGIGIVGRGALLKADAVADLRRDEAFAWLCEDMPPLGAMTAGAAGATSVQWATPGPAALIGDAAIARDPLSSLGLAASLSDAHYAVAALLADNADALRDRQRENLGAHLQHLRETLRHCRHRDAPHWAAYENFVAASIAGGAAARPAPALQRGRLQTAALDPTFY